VAAKTPNPCFGATLEKRPYPCDHWAVALPFTPSTKQLKAYAAFNKHKVVYDRRVDPPKVTFDEKARVKLKKWYPKDVVYATLDEFHSVQKVKGTYIDGIGPLMRDGRVGGEFNHTPITLRLAQKEPSLLNLPRVDAKDKASIYNYVRALYISGPGQLLMARDYASIEAVMVGYLANDPVYVRLAKLGVHDFFVSHVIGKPADLAWSDADLRAYFEELKRTQKPLRQKCKTVVHASNYLTTPFKVHMEFPDVFPDVGSARWYQDAYLRLFPKLKTWQYATCEEAEQHGFVTAPSGFRMHYTEPFEYKFNKAKGKWTKEYGPQAKEVVAAKPQHMGAVYLMTAAVAMAREYPEFKACMRLLIHDEVFWECPEDEAEAWDVKMQAVMERPLACMPCPPDWGQGDFLSVLTEGKKGNRWSDMR